MTKTNPSLLVAELEKKYAWATEHSDQNLEETILAGLNWEAHYWIDCALDWIDHGYPLNSQIVEILDNISQDKRKPQKTRHRCFAFVKKWRRNEEQN